MSADLKNVMSNVILSILKENDLECEKEDIKLSSSTTVCKATLHCGDYVVAKYIECSFKKKMGSIKEKLGDIEYSSYICERYINDQFLKLSIQRGESLSISKAIYDVISVFTDGMELDNTVENVFLRRVEIHKYVSVAKVTAHYLKEVRTDAGKRFKPGSFYIEFDMDKGKVVLNKCKMVNVIPEGVLLSDYSDLYLENRESHSDDGNWYNDPLNSKYLGHIILDYLLERSLPVLLSGGRNDLNIVMYSTKSKNSLKYTIGAISIEGFKPTDLDVSFKNNVFAVGVPSALLIEWKDPDIYREDYTPAVLDEMRSKLGISATSPESAFEEAVKVIDFVCIDSLWKTYVIE